MGHFYCIDTTFTQNGKYPWIGALSIGSNNGSNRNVKCGSTLVAANWVVTAAHCVIKVFKPPLSNAGVPNMSVVLGEHDLRSSTDSFDTKR